FDLLFEAVEIGRVRNLKADPRALCLRALAQHDRVMIDSRGEVDGVFLLRHQGQPDNVGIVFGLLREIGRLIGGVRDLAYADPCRHPFTHFRSTWGSAAMTSTIAATSLSPRPISAQRR